MRGEESDRDEAFVRDFCQGYGIGLTVGQGNVIPGEKGLEAAARDARYQFLRCLPGKIATAHTADDNAETLLMHLVRGTGLKGLGGIAPVRGNLIRPMLMITRQQVMAFIEEYHLSYVEDSSNGTDQFLRNRLRHHVMPLLKEENPQLAKNLSATALRLRQDEESLAAMDSGADRLDVILLRRMDPALRSRTLAGFLRQCGVKEPEAEHIALAQQLVFSEKPSARGDFPGGVTLRRRYNVLEKVTPALALEAMTLPSQGTAEIPGLEWTVRILPSESGSVTPSGPMILRTRQPGDTMRLSGGTKSLKKLFIDRKIPAGQRDQIPVIADCRGVLWVYGVGPNLDRLGPGVAITFEEKKL